MTCSESRHAKRTRRTARTARSTPAPHAGARARLPGRGARAPAQWRPKTVRASATLAMHGGGGGRVFPTCRRVSRSRLYTNMHPMIHDESTALTVPLPMCPSRTAARSCVHCLDARQRLHRAPPLRARAPQTHTHGRTNNRHACVGSGAATTPRGRRRAGRSTSGRAPARRPSRTADCRTCGARSPFE